MRKIDSLREAANCADGSGTAGNGGFRDVVGGEVAADEGALGGAVIARRLGAEHLGRFLLELRERLRERQQRKGEKREHDREPAGDDVAESDRRNVGFEHVPDDGDRHPGAHPEHEHRIGVRIFGEKGEAALAVRMGRDQPELERGDPPQAASPRRYSARGRGTAGSRRAARCRSTLHHPASVSVRCRRRPEPPRSSCRTSVRMSSRASVPDDRKAQADDFGRARSRAVSAPSPRRSPPLRTKPAPGSARGPAGRACRCKPYSTCCSARTKRPIGDEEARPGAEVEQKGVRIRRAERAPGDEAQNEWNAPGERDEHRRPAAGEQGVLPQHPEPPLQFKERPAMRGEIFPDPARLVLCRRRGRCLRSPQPHSVMCPASLAALDSDS